MSATVVFATSLALSAVAMSAGAAAAQGARGALAHQRERDQLPCAVTASVIDSARDDAVSILFNNRPIMAELRQEHGIPSSASQVAMTPVVDGALCKRLASQFDHVLPPSARIAVLRVGPIFYARDPDQRHTTGIFADSTFHVLMRLGAAVEK